MENNLLNKLAKFITIAAYVVIVDLVAIGAVSSWIFWNVKVMGNDVVMGVDYDVPLEHSRR